jgi:ATP/maltotriose-dependent transcriptional regulator MalT
VIKAAASFAPIFPDNGQGEHLTARELEVLTLMAEPISLAEIADRLNISYATVKRYAINLYSKLGVHSRWEAVAVAAQSGILWRSSTSRRS